MQRLFHLLWQPSALGGNLTMWPTFLHLPEKAFISTSVWPRREYTWTLNWKESFFICFDNCQGVPYFYRKIRNRMMNRMWLPPHVKDSLEDKSMIVHSKEAFLVPSFWPWTEHTWTLTWKKSLMIWFKSYQGISYSHIGHRQSRQKMVNTLLMVNVNPICIR